MTGWSVRTVPAAGARFTLFPSMGEYPAYDDRVYDAFDAADDRHRAYRNAIRSAALGRVVLEIGTGRDALWAIEAARSGARHVYAIEADPAAARRAARAVATAGLAAQVTVLPGLSTEQTLPVRAEVCVSEIVGNIASAEGAIPVLADARHRLTAPDCVWIPFRMQTWAAAVDLSAAGDLALAAESLPYLRAVFAATGGPFDPRLCLAGPAAEAIISTAAPVESVIFETRPAPPAPKAPPAKQTPSSAYSDATSSAYPDAPCSAYRDASCSAYRDAPPPTSAPTSLRGAPVPCATPEAEVTIELRAETTGRMTGLLLWTRVAVSASGGREIDALAAGTRAWAPVYVPLSREPAQLAPISRKAAPDDPPEAPTSLKVGHQGGRAGDGVSGQGGLRPGDTIRVTFVRRVGEDGIHPDYEITVDDRPALSLPHHGGPFRATPFYRDLFGLQCVAS